MASCRTVAACLLSVGLLAGGVRLALAQETEATSRDVRGVVELFTSQGCPECPPADALIARQGRTQGIVALAYHVDYWDYIGWQDPLAARKNAERQKAYAKRLKLGTLATPQIVVNGDTVLDRPDDRALVRLLEANPPEADAEVRLTIRDETLQIEARTAQVRPGAPAPVLMLVTYADRVETAVTRGENEGRVLVDHHPVRDWRLLGMVDEETMRVDMPLALLAEPDGRRTGLAALLQVVGEDKKPGRILAAAALEF
ncbi:DUF1223 domain-containing protein [Aureimonas sp. ME7]|uniref:DUF1223 domain-containing protein n=1 Tax=Aureimonas sp. ME7 TaxID=2744252 RepID=UPI0015F6E676|nr:DUF1223 domain-containing protein [Aureimonas sp. ME7]